MNSCCSSLDSALSEHKTPTLRKDKNGLVYLVIERADLHLMEQAIRFCPFCGINIWIPETHKLENTFNTEEKLEITFLDGHILDVSRCNPIDYSIYGLKGGWCCTVEGAYDLRSKKLFRNGSGVDIYEQDILKIAAKQDGKILYENQKAEQGAALNSRHA
jgi:hypothetical protein